ncbi:MAG TPA: hypothetical protein VF401_01790 [Candidatus Saccharimonadales bacterium]
MSPSDSPTIDYDKLEQALAGPANDPELYKAIVNAPFDTHRVETAFMFLGIVVFLLVDKESGLIKRLALSNTELAKNTTNVSAVPFEQIDIPLNHEENIIAKAIRTGNPQDTTDWKFLFEPALTPDQARINQASAGVAYSAVYPLKARDGGAIIFSYFQYASNIGDVQREFMSQYAEIVRRRLASD